MITYILHIPAIQILPPPCILAVFIYMSSDETMSISVDDMDDKIKIISE